LHIRDVRDVRDVTFLTSTLKKRVICFFEHLVSKLEVSDTVHLFLMNVREPT
jgi:hypothetical protein